MTWLVVFVAGVACAWGFTSWRRLRVVLQPVPVRCGSHATTRRPDEVRSGDEGVRRKP